MTAPSARYPQGPVYRDIFGRRYHPGNFSQPVRLDAIARDTEVVQRGERYFLVIELTPDSLAALAAIGAEADDLEPETDEHGHQSLVNGFDRLSDAEARALDADLATARRQFVSIESR